MTGNIVKIVFTKLDKDEIMYYWWPLLGNSSFSLNIFNFLALALTLISSYIFFVDVPFCPAANVVHLALDPWDSLQPQTTSRATTDPSSPIRFTEITRDTMGR